jgi:hypothetical protein
MLSLAFVLTRALAIPAPDGPVVGAAILLTFDVEARNRAEDFKPYVGVAADLDLCFHRPKRVECLIQQIAHDASLWVITSRADITDREVVVHPHVALDETGDLPVAGRAIEAFEDEDVAAASGTLVTLATTLVVRVGKGRPDRIA